MHDPPHFWLQIAATCCRLSTAWLWSEQLQPMTVEAAARQAPAAVADQLEDPEAVAALLCCIRPAPHPPTNVAAGTATATESVPEWGSEPEVEPPLPPLPPPEPLPATPAAGQAGAVTVTVTRGGRKCTAEPGPQAAQRLEYPWDAEQGNGSPTQSAKRQRTANQADAGRISSTAWEKGGQRSPAQPAMHQTAGTGMAQPPAAPPAAAQGSKGAAGSLKQQVLSAAASSSPWWLLPGAMQRQLEGDVPVGGAAEALLKRAVARMHFSRESHQLGDLGNSLAGLDP